jgi:hypothetical protein
MEPLSTQQERKGSSMRRIVVLFGRPFVAAVFAAIIAGVWAGEAMGQPLDAAGLKVLGRWLLQAHSPATGPTLLDAAELKVLDRWTGDWIFEGSLEKTKFQPEGGHFAGTMVGKWSLRNRWVVASASGDLIEALVLQTYDFQNRAYRCWIHSAEGETLEFSGAWDPASNTITYKPAHAGEGNALATLKFVDADHSEWELVVKDSGTVAVHQHVKLTRWKYPLRKLTKEELETDIALREMLRQVKLTDGGGGRFTGTGRDVQDRLVELEITQEEHRRAWKATWRSANDTHVDNGAVGW